MTIRKKPADRVRWVGEVESHQEAAARLKNGGDAVLVVRGRPRLVVMMCPCGCGDLLPINLDPRLGPAWRLYRRRGKLSLYPSVDRESGCRSHFVIWNDNIWMGEVTRRSRFSKGTRVNGVLPWLARNGPARYDAVADAIDEVPWEVLRTCRRLAREGKVTEVEPNVFAVLGVPA